MEIIKIDIICYIQNKMGFFSNLASILVFKLNSTFAVKPIPPFLLNRRG